VSDLYRSADIEQCRRADHKFRPTWSDKTPMKVSLMCVTCTDANLRSTYVAYSLERGPNFGAWRRQSTKEAAIDE
jgi:hypothetical protein